MNSRYAVYLCDLRRRRDRRVGSRVNRRAAERVARLCNAEALRRRAPADGLPRPLYYVLREEG